MATCAMAGASPSSWGMSPASRFRPPSSWSRRRGSSRRARGPIPIPASCSESRTSEHDAGIGIGHRARVDDLLRRDHEEGGRNRLAGDIPHDEGEAPAIAHVAVHLEEVVEITADDSGRPAHAEERDAGYARQLAWEEARLDFARDVEVALHLRAPRELFVQARGLEPEGALVRDREEVVEVLPRKLLLRPLAPDREEPEELAVRRERQQDLSLIHISEPTRRTPIS